MSETKQQIKDWLLLEKPDFFTGIQLAEKAISGRRVLLNQLYKMRSKPYAIEKLTYELNKFLGDDKVVFAAQTKAKVAFFAEKTESPVVFPEKLAGGYLPGKVKEMDEAIYKRSQLSNELSELTAAGKLDEAKAKNAEVEYADLQVRKLESQIDFFKETGKPFEPKPKAEKSETKTVDELIKRRNSLRSQVSRERNKVEDNPEDAKSASRLEKLLAELGEVEKQIIKD
jgi:hypothetical protein